jgi:hypothetical protein
MGTCKSTTPEHGTGFIFRGGDSWHFGNSSASPYVGSGNPGWNVTWSGSSGNPIYWGVDQTWYSGSVWARPVMTGDNPTSATGVSSCAYDQSYFTALNYNIQSYNTFDNLEFTGFCWHGNQSNANESICCMRHITGAQESTTPTYNTLSNVYIHGWSHATFSCSETGGEPTGNCDGAYGISLGSNSTYEKGDTIVGTVIDGSDTDKASLCAICFAGYDIHNSVLRYLANGVVTNNTHVFHDNLLEYLLQSGDGETHTNGFEFNVEWAGTNAVYNNVIRNLWLSGACEVTQWMAPNTTDYYFNNSVYGLGCNGNYFDIVGGPSGGSNGWTAYLFNNTWVVPAAGAINANPAGTTAHWSNNHCIIPGGGTSGSCYAGAGTLNYLTNVVQDTTVASGQGYTASETYAYSPSASTNATAGAGTNEEGYCTTLLGSSDTLLQAAGTACKSDTGYACSYNSTTHSVTCPARTVVARPPSAVWDAGAYEYQGGAVAPATNLKATPH